MVRYGMAINVGRCQGCSTCSVACKMSNNLPKDIWRNRIDTDGGEFRKTARGEYPKNLAKTYYPISCQQCTNAPCVAVCPTNASAIRDDGIVSIDTSECIGCGSCIKACPYDARTLNSSEIEYYTEHALGDYDAPEHVNNTVEKCDFCIHRIERGEVPACMEFCPVNARHWGDLDDPESDVSKYLAQYKGTQLLSEEGTEPNCFYVMEALPQ